ncbi:uncharacterized protein LOC130957543 [Arachis stenosperma]|uniref:uncharacterized protein LOC130957543 n=1 Tax=Arachis stenosperma TaxID=217475 RepID=UPI0025ABF304|nr:uncharacterized protein LOC130957543 [Arachis stenosperma]
MWGHGVSNTNYNSKLFINVEFPAVRNFFARVNKLDPVDGQGIMLLVCDQLVSVEEDFLRLSVYKTIAKIKEHNQDAVFVTAGTIKEVKTEFGWWYSIHIRVIDHTDAASFVLFDREAAKFLGVSANDLRQSCVTKGVEKNFCPEEINKLRNTKFIFKVIAKTDQPDFDDACESELTLSPAVDEKYNSKILGAKKHTEEVGEESISSKSKKGKWVVMED